MLTITEIKNIMQSIEFSNSFYIELLIDFNVMNYKIQNASFPEKMVNSTGKYIIGLILNENGMHVYSENEEVFGNIPTIEELIVSHELKKQSVKAEFIDQIIGLVEKEDKLKHFKLPLIFLSNACFI
ncbi:hypothetical protein [Bacillus cereus group sp. TH152-1LC]|uniref:hypothetical protein n=1 Tax=Bacillus cereus group sp. TH152-1LC TaxID=3018060 RepID=UPI0022E76BEA|nr:hypothetical protein [Bacillus cereus group sp. TH152-1LC]MDA1675385.1 hypothetical protein [Bacillus cereus group sp. TH152-1LC]